MDKITRLTELGYSPDQAEQIANVLTQPAGLILFVGSEGRGHGTCVATLLSMKRDAGARLGHLYPEDNSDDPEESLKAVLRSDPDCIGVSEIRSRERARGVMKLAHAGHLVVSSLCTGSGAFSAFDRLADLGVSREWLSNPRLPVLFVSQAFVPVLCPACKVPASRGLPFFRRTSRVHTRNVPGCMVCGHSGVIGKTLCAEVVEKSPSMEQAILAGDNASIWSIWRNELDGGNKDRMRGRHAVEHAVWKMDQGICSRNDVSWVFGALP